MLSRQFRKLVRELPDPISGPVVRKFFDIEKSQAEGFVFKIAQTRDELEAAYRLVHDVYVEEGYADPQETGTRINLRYALPTTTTFIGTLGGQVVITMTLIGDSPLGLPMDMVFSEELFGLRRQGRFITEVGAFASHPEFRGKQQVLAMYLNKIMYTYARYNLGSDDLVIAINPKHEWVYRTLLLFEKIAGTRPYRYVKGAPAIAMRLDLRTCQARWEKVYRGRSPEANLYHFFAVERTAEIHLPESGGILDVWDEGVFSHFFDNGSDPRREGCSSLADLHRTLGYAGGGPLSLRFEKGEWSSDSASLECRPGEKEARSETMRGLAATAFSGVRGVNP